MLSVVAAYALAVQTLIFAFGMPCPDIGFDPGIGVICAGQVTVTPGGSPQHQPQAPSSCPCCSMMACAAAAVLPTQAFASVVPQRIAERVAFELSWRADNAPPRRILGPPLGSRAPPSLRSIFA